MVNIIVTFKDQLVLLDNKHYFDDLIIDLIINVIVKSISNINNPPNRLGINNKLLIATSSDQRSRSEDVEVETVFTGGRRVFITRLDTTRTEVQVHRITSRTYIVMCLLCPKVEQQPVIIDVDPARGP